MFEAKVKLCEPVSYRFDDGKNYKGFKITISGDDSSYVRFHSVKELKEGSMIKVGVRQFGKTIKLFPID